MSFLHRSKRLAVDVVWFALLGAVALGCSGKSERDEDEGDDDTGGTSSLGGTSGVGAGGTSGVGAGGTSGVGATAGTGAGQASCLNVCERTLACPGTTPADCEADCALIYANGCIAQVERLFACMAGFDACNPPVGACESEINAYSDCLTGGGSCTPETAPSSASCSTICAQVDACPEAEPDCLGSCADAVADAATMGCSTEYQAFLGCVSTCTSCVLNIDDCPQLDAFIDCSSAYCALNPTSPPCL